jgi:hypothetical protein
MDRAGQAHIHESVVFATAQQMSHPHCERNAVVNNLLDAIMRQVNRVWQHDANDHLQVEHGDPAHTCTSMPNRASCRAAIKPVTPAPITTATAGASSDAGTDWVETAQLKLAASELSLRWKSACRPAGLTDGLTRFLNPYAPVLCQFES